MDNVSAATERPLHTNKHAPRVAALLASLSLRDKIGQMAQWNVGHEGLYPDLRAALTAGQVGSVLNVVDVELVNELQRIATEETEHGIPLLVGRDVIHGFRTVMPIPLGQGASWNPALVRNCAEVAAREAARCGVNWTFAPMIDVARDPRWGRIAESFGEDPFLTATLGVAMVEGFQGADLATPGAIAACAKHFVGYGAAESGRDYATTNIAANELRNVHLRPFQAAVDAGVATLMTSFSDIDGIPATASAELVRDVLHNEWGFSGFVVSDWDSIRQLSVHGLTANDRDSALEAASAGVGMEMHGDAYRNHLADLVESGALAESVIDAAVSRILELKFALGLFDNPYTNPDSFAPLGNDAALATAKQAALESVVLLKNHDDVLPLDVTAVSSIAVIGPLADTPREQLGTWVFDGDPALSITPLAALNTRLADSVTVHHVPALPTSRSRDTGGFSAAVEAASASDVVLLFLGEEAILSGEAHSRADIGLPGAQAALVRELRATGKPVVAIVLTGRPLVLTGIVADVDAILFCAHPGTMGGPAIVDVLLGDASPVGRLAATLPRMVGQIPIYHSQKNTGKPPTPESTVHIDDIDANAEQLSIGMTAYHLDAGYTPLFPFGYGLTYSKIDYREIDCIPAEVALGGTVSVRAKLTNTGARAVTETAQLYIRDLVGSVTRPVRELKGFQRVTLAPGETQTVQFDLSTDALAFYTRQRRFATEPGEFHVFVGASADAELKTSFWVTAA